MNTDMAKKEIEIREEKARLEQRELEVVKKQRELEDLKVQRSLHQHDIRIFRQKQLDLDLAFQKLNQEKRDIENQTQRSLIIAQEKEETISSQEAQLKNKLNLIDKQLQEGLLRKVSEDDKHIEQKRQLEKREERIADREKSLFEKERQFLISKKDDKEKLQKLMSFNDQTRIDLKNKIEAYLELKKIAGTENLRKYIREMREVQNLSSSLISQNKKQLKQIAGLNKRLAAFSSEHKEAVSYIYELEGRVDELSTMKAQLQKKNSQLHQSHSNKQKHLSQWKEKYQNLEQKYFNSAENFKGAKENFKEQVMALKDSFFKKEVAIKTKNAELESYKQKLTLKQRAVHEENERLIAERKDFEKKKYAAFYQVKFLKTKLNELKSTFKQRLFKKEQALQLSRKEKDTLQRQMRALNTQRSFLDTERKKLSLGLRTAKEKISFEKKRNFEKQSYIRECRVEIEKSKKSLAGERQVSQGIKEAYVQAQYDSKMKIAELEAQLEKQRAFNVEKVNLKIT